VYALGTKIWRARSFSWSRKSFMKAFTAYLKKYKSNQKKFNFRSSKNFGLDPHQGSEKSLEPGT
jgi:hypothetical protein